MEGVTSKAFDFSSFYRATLRPLRDYLSRVLGSRSEAEDVAQNAFVRVHSQMAVQNVAAPRNFLFTTARWLALDELRRRRRRPIAYIESAALEETPSEAPCVDQVVMARQELARLEEMPAPSSWISPSVFHSAPAVAAHPMARIALRQKFRK